ncbi:MAG: CHAT domain-containing protein [Anaerolineae bacterium]|nr:CHAT domain-containing protein [Anaerolineae bacterium]
MALTLHISTHDDHIHVTRDGAETIKSALSGLPDRAQALAAPYEYGPALFDALGGDDLMNALRRERDKTLYLAIPQGDPADSLAWECAVKPPKTFLVHRVPLLRLVDAEAWLDDTPGPVRLLALGADALVDKQGRARNTRRLDILQEMRQIERTLHDSGKAVTGERIAPTPTALGNALGDGRRTLLHLSCHGSVLQTDHGPEPMLHLEDANGVSALLGGNMLTSYLSTAQVHLTLLSACRVAEGYGGLTRALVSDTMPAAIGMQGRFWDHLADDFAAALYRGLLAGRTLGIALQMARQTLLNESEGHETQVGLPVGYVAAGGDAPLPLQAGRPQLRRLDLGANVSLPPTVQAPEPLLGRNGELHALAKLAQQHNVITVIGTGGMGKTALAAAYARRFGLRYRDGVLGYSFAAGEVDDGDFRRALLERLVGDALADQSAEQQAQTILDELRRRELLLLVDNFESVQQADERADHPQHAAAKAIYDLLAKIANNGGRLLITSRRQPTELEHERVFPGRDNLLPGIDQRAAAELFFRHSSRAKEQNDERQERSVRRTVQRLAREISKVTGGHPLAVALLGSEYDKGDAPPDTFLDNWADELAAARSRGLDRHHATFAVAFDRSYAALSAAAQWQLRALSVIPFPFFATGAALLWPGDADDNEMHTTKTALRALVDRSLIEIDLLYNDKTPATYRFQPAVQQEAARRLSIEEEEALQPRFARYAAWLSNQAYGDIHKAGNTALVRLVQPTLDTLANAADHLAGTNRWWHLRRVGWLMNAFGRTGDAHALLSATLAELDAADAGDEALKVRSSMVYELANLEVTRGDLDRALALYQESLQLNRRHPRQGRLALDDGPGLSHPRRPRPRPRPLPGIVAVPGANRRHPRQGRLAASDGPGLSHPRRPRPRPRPLPGIVAVPEQIGDIQGKAASLSMMAQVFLTRGDLDRALALYQESLQFLEQIGDIQGKAASLSMMAQVFLTRGDLDRALASPGIVAGL